MTPPIRTLSDLAATLGPVRDSVLRAAAAMQLMPDNATKWMRLQRLVEACSGAESTEPQRLVSAGRLRKLLTTPPVVTAELLNGEDPFEESFTAEITFYGGSYTVVMGGATAAHSACQLVLDAVRRLPKDPFHNYRASVFADATVLLTLSDAMCRRARLGRWVAPAESPRTPLRLPPSAELEALGAAATFTSADLTDLLGPARSHVDELTASEPIGLVEHDEESPTDDRLYLYPLLRLLDEATIISLPGALTGALVHRALARAVRFGATNALVAALHDVTMANIAKYARRMHWVPISAPGELSPPEDFAESFWRFDIDKVAHVVTVVDRLEGYEAGQPFASADMTSVQLALHERFDAVRRQRKGLEASNLLHVVCSAVLGRTWFLGFAAEATDEESALLLLTIDDLDILTGLELPDPVRLWKFAQASTALHNQVRVMSFSKLDEFAIYRGHNDGFYLGDEGLPTMLSVSPGTGAKLRVDERQRRDPHAAAMPDGSAIVEVERWAADDSAPIYRPGDPRIHGHHLVELDRPCWIVPAPAPGEPAEASEDLAEAVAFWVWRCRDDLVRPLATPPLATTGLIVKVRLAPQADPEPNADVEPVASWLNCEASTTGRCVNLVLLEGAASRLRGPGNDAERAMAGALVEAIHDLAELEREGLAAAVADSLPAGPMKMFQVLALEDDPLLALGITARPRLVARADIENVLDEVGAICRDVLNLAEGRISQDDRTKVLNDVVGELFHRMGRVLVKLDPIGLLENLAAEQEAISFLEARARLLAPSQAACFGDESSALRRAIDSNQALVSTAVASRFLIEYITAIPPTGSRPLSVCTYDLLLAYAKEVVEFGYLSDAIRYGLSTSSLSILPSGRLGSSRQEAFHEVIRIFTQVTSRQSLDSARRSFARHWMEVPRTESDFDPTLLNEALQAEFGITATEHAELAGDLIELSRDETRQIATRPLGDLVDVLSDSLGWLPDKVRHALDMFVLGMLSSFPPAKNAADTFPWRFSRDRSAARRPLYMRPSPSGGPDLVWGPRSIYRSSRYLFDQIHSARLKARSPEMKRYISRARSVANNEFNQNVAQFYRAAGYLDVRENVKRFGPIRLVRANGQDIGDIDVVVVDRDSKVILAIEVKDFQFARTPFELSNEISKLVGEEGSAIGHHQERISFLKTNLEVIIRELGLPESARHWQVHGLVVTSTDLMAAHFSGLHHEGRRMKIVSYDELSMANRRTLTSRTRINPATRADRRRRRRR